MAGATRMMREHGAPWLFGSDAPETLIQPYDWTAEVTDIGTQAVRHGRWPIPTPRVPAVHAATWSSPPDTKNLLHIRVSPRLHIPTIAVYRPMMPHSSMPIFLTLLLTARPADADIPRAPLHEPVPTPMTGDTGETGGDGKPPRTDDSTSEDSTSDEDTGDPSPETPLTGRGCDCTATPSPPWLLLLCLTPRRRRR